MPDERILEIFREGRLTEEQQAAALDAGNEVLALACAGSGKSRTLAYRIARLLIQGEDPKSIVAFTFTEKAAESIKLRVADALTSAGLNPTVLGAMYLGTIHSFCQRVLGEMDATYRQFDVLDENRLKLFLISRYPALGLQTLRPRTATAKSPNGRMFETIQQVGDAWKTMNDEMASVEEVSAHDAILGDALGRLRDRLQEDEFIDFSLMIRLVVDALQRADPSTLRAPSIARLKHLMVDEYQDVNPAQEALIQGLHAISSTLFVVGDDDQAIYAWRGADVSNIMDFEVRHGLQRRHTLSRNFRSTQAIVSTADGFAAAVLGASRITKTPEAENPTGPRHFGVHWFPDRATEADWVADRIAALIGTSYVESNGQVRGLTPGDFAILMRSTRTVDQSGVPRHLAFTQALESRGIRFSLESGGGVFDRQQVAVLRDTFLLLRNDSPTRDEAREHFDNSVLGAYPHADFNKLTSVLSDWGRQIHEPTVVTRRRVFPQQLVHDLLEAFDVANSDFEPLIMRDIGIFSRIIQDVETVYVSVDSSHRFQDICNFLQNVADSGYDTSTDDVLQRPDAVTVSTVHKVKGLEFPVVLMVDIEQGRFPGSQKRYRGWLPSAVIQPAINRGAYQRTPNEEARLFYTAMTRAERYLYVVGCASLPGGKAIAKQSQYTLRLTHDEIEPDSSVLPAGLQPHTPSARVDETVIPTSFSEIRYYLSCPKSYQFRKSFGFSPPIPEMFGYGKTVHTAIEKLHELFEQRAPTVTEAAEVTESVFHLKHIPPSGDPVNRPGGYERAKTAAIEISQDYVKAYGVDFGRSKQVEVRFEIPLAQAVIAGAIDLLLKVDQENQIIEASVIDFKAMQGGPDPETNERLHWTELALQVQLYAKAATEVLGERAKTGAVHLLKDGQRVNVPISDEALDAAVSNVEWGVSRILEGDFPMRPSPVKCAACDFRQLCAQRAEAFHSNLMPPPIHVPKVKPVMARAFSEFAG